MKKEGLNIAVAGATGAVGRKIIEILESRDFPLKQLRLLASHRSEGTELLFKDQMIKVEMLSENSFNGTDIAFFSAGSKRSLQFANAAVKSGAVVIDNSSAFRNRDDVPLVIPEINPDKIFSHRGIISNPNCTTAIMLTVIHSFHRAARIKKILVSTYQSVSGAGLKGIEELQSQISGGSESAKPSCFPHKIAFNVIPHIEQFNSDGYTAEELKMQNETRKILEDSEIGVSATCVRVPVISAHSMSVTVVTEDPIEVLQARRMIRSSAGVRLLDDCMNNLYPMPLNSEGKDECFAGRIRKDSALPNALTMWICGDQLLKGAALNAVQIAELLIKDRLW